nr:Tol-Pal system protein TolB [Pseudomonadota bacterium]
MKPIVRMMLFAAALLGGGAAQAQLTIEITKGVEGALPIAVVPFATAAPTPENVAEVVAADLGRSGRLAPLSPQEFLDRPYDFSQVNFANWRALQVDYLVLGQVQPQGAGFTVQFQLVDVFQSNRLLSYTFDVQPQALRKVAHQISDLVYERLTGEKGIFSTRIAYISAARQTGAPPSPGQAGGGVTTTYTLAVADYDGYNPQVVLRSTAPIMSPAWSPDGSLLAYVTFEKRKAQIVAQNLYSGERFTVADHPGINGAPAWSPDGRRMAFTLSRDGNPEIYLYDLASRNLTRLTTNSAIDTEPS